MSQPVYQDTSGSPFVLVDIDVGPISGVAIGHAVNLIADSGVYPRPIVWWHQDSPEGFQGHLADTAVAGTAAAAIRMKPAEQQATTVERAVRAVRRVPHDGTYVIGSDFMDIQEDETESIRGILLNLITQVQDKTGKRFVLVTSGSRLCERHGDLLETLQGRNPGIGCFRLPVVAQKSTTLSSLRDAIDMPVPDSSDKPWDWADSMEWAERIDQMTLTDVQQVIRDGAAKPALDRMRAALVEAQGRFCRRDRALEMLVACALARVNLVFLGPPGTAKSLLVRTFAKTLGVTDAPCPISQESAVAEEAKRPNAASDQKSGKTGRRLFEYLLTRYTTPEEIFGGADISLLLAAGVHGRRTAGMLPQAEIGFLDELFKANTAILNALLSLTNERLFYNFGRAFRVNLAFVVGASNETPAEDELGALYDRFPIRVPCLSVPVEEQSKVILHAHHDDVSKTLGITEGHSKELGIIGPVKRRACLNDLRLLSKVILADERYGGVASAFPRDGSTFQHDFIQMLASVRDEFKISDRTPNLVLRCCRALALLEDSQRLSGRHLRAWGYVAPKIAAARDLQRHLRGRIHQLDADAGNLFDEI